MIGADMYNLPIDSKFGTSVQQARNARCGRGLIGKYVDAKDNSDCLIQPAAEWIVTHIIAPRVPGLHFLKRLMPSLRTRRLRKFRARWRSPSGHLRLVLLI